MSRLKQILVLAVVAVTVWGTLPSQATAWGRGHFYVIGIGPSGPRMATQQALETIKRMDVVLASKATHTQTKLFSDYIGDKPIPFDPWSGLFDYKGKSTIPAYDTRFVMQTAPSNSRIRNLEIKSSEPHFICLRGFYYRGPAEPDETLE